MTEKTTDFEDILYEEREGTAWITINRPKVYNAFRAKTCEELSSAISLAGWNKEIGAIVLAGSGDKAFCTGGDQSEHDGAYKGRGTIGLPIEEVHSAIRDVPVPVIARVQGYAIGGLAVGESKSQMYQIIHQVAGQLPEDKPRYLMGVGSPEDLVESVARGIDMFDCVLPTRIARNGALFSKQGRINIVSASHRQRDEPLEVGCDCYTCQTFSAGYLHHLFRAKELLGYRLATIHNLRFILRLMEEIREAIFKKNFQPVSYTHLTLPTILLV